MAVLEAVSLIRSSKLVSTTNTRHSSFTIHCSLGDSRMLQAPQAQLSSPSESKLLLGPRHHETDGRLSSTQIHPHYSQRKSEMEMAQYLVGFLGHVFVLAQTHLRPLGAALASMVSAASHKMRLKSKMPGLWRY